VPGYCEKHKVFLVSLYGRVKQGDVSLVYHEGENILIEVSPDRFSIDKIKTKNEDYPLTVQGPFIPTDTQSDIKDEFLIHLMEREITKSITRKDKDTGLHPLEEWFLDYKQSDRRNIIIDIDPYDFFRTSYQRQTDINRNVREFESPEQKIVVYGALHFTSFAPLLINELDLAGKTVTLLLPNIPRMFHMYELQDIPLEEIPNHGVEIFELYLGLIGQQEELNPKVIADYFTQREPSAVKK